LKASSRLKAMLGGLYARRRMKNSGPASVWLALVEGFAVTILDGVEACPDESV
jgi:hypothetical protein